MENQGDDQLKSGKEEKPESNTGNSGKAVNEQNLDFVSATSSETDEKEMPAEKRSETAGFVNDEPGDKNDCCPERCFDKMFPGEWRKAEIPDGKEMYRCFIVGVIIISVLLVTGLCIILWLFNKDLWYVMGMTFITLIVIIGLFFIICYGIYKTEERKEQKRAEFRLKYLEMGKGIINTLIAKEDCMQRESRLEKEISGLKQKCEELEEELKNKRESIDNRSQDNAKFDAMKEAADRYKNQNDTFMGFFQRIVETMVKKMD